MSIVILILVVTLMILTSVYGIAITLCYHNLNKRVEYLEDCVMGDKSDHELTEEEIEILQEDLRQKCDLLK